MMRMKQERFQKTINELKDKKVTLILFGSQIKGTATPLSDYDILLIGDAEIELDFIDQFKYRDEEEVMREIMKLNTVVLDALLEGKPIIDNLKIFEKLKETAQNIVKERKIKKQN